MTTRPLLPAGFLAFFTYAILSVTSGWRATGDRCSLKARINAAGNFDLECNGSCNGVNAGCGATITYFPGGLFIVCKCSTSGGWATPATPCIGYALSGDGGQTYYLDCGPNTCQYDCFVNSMIDEVSFKSVCVCPS
ncbi:MAG: hypothetical protein HY286_19225 [Planctomycetes bacterium]|nr:hypothetical protein [Planctomycetota bacterium]